MTSFLLKEDTGYILQETNDKIILQEGTSPSASISPSSSLSPSASFSASISPSPSEGYRLYSRGIIANGRYKYGGENGVRWTYGKHLRYGGRTGPDVDDSDMDHTYTEQEEVDVETVDNIFVGQTGALVYMVHLFKTFVDTKNYCSIAWVGQSSLEPTLSTVYLQIYNYTTALWETIDSNSKASYDESFELEDRITDLTDYKNASNVISCRVYQLAL